MKKLLCLLFSALLVLSLAACESEEYEEQYEENTQNTEKAPDTALASYDVAIRLMMKTFSNSFTKEELKAMYPDLCWTYFAEEKGKSLDEIYADFSARMAENWEKTKEAVGEGAAVKFELLDRIDYEGDEYEAFKAEMEEKYGIARERFGVCYEVTLKKATVGKLREDISQQIYHVFELEGTWYVWEVLTNMPLIV